MDPRNKKWTALVVTTKTSKEAEAVENELLVYQRKGIIPEETVVLTINDPASSKLGGEGSVGSGGATMNALLCTVEQLCARRGYQVLSPDVLTDSNILIIHHGRSYPFGGSSRGFTLVPCYELFTKSCVELTTNIIHLYRFVTDKLLPEFHDGLWVCSSDMIIQYNKGLACLNRICPSKSDACLITVPAAPAYATDHGVAEVDDHGHVANILYSAAKSQLETVTDVNGAVALVSGIVYLSVELAERLLRLQASPALECCTYIGHDVGSQPHPISLFFDILLAMCSRVSKDDFMSRSSSITRPDTKGRGDADRESALKVRQLIWDNMRKFNLTAGHVLGARHHYLSMSLCAEEHLKTIQSFQEMENVHSLPSGHQCGDRLLHSINSVLTTQSNLGPIYLINSYIESKLRLTSNVFVSNVDTRLDYFGEDALTLKSGLCLQVAEISFQSPRITSIHVPFVYGMKDALIAVYGPGETTYCELKWTEFFASSGITAPDLWSASSNQRTIWNAKLFPVLTSDGEPKMKDLFWAFGGVVTNENLVNRWRSSWRFSLEEIFRAVDMSAEFKMRRCLFYEVLKQKLKLTLRLGTDFYFLPYFRSAVVDGFAEDILASLDAAAVGQSPGITARTLALIADILGCMAKSCGGLRSGPAGNKAFAYAYLAFEKGQISDGVSLMAKERENWTSRPDMLIRCARHYEGAAQICIRQAVLSAKQFISLGRSSVKLTDNSNKNLWYIAECPARIDLSGGWTDTPPICYEKGGFVVNAALLIDGKRPIGAKIRRTERLSIVLASDATTFLDKNVLSDLSDLRDFCIPNAPGALLKACILFAEIVDLNSEHSLEEQLAEKWNCGFEIVTWSNLPQGSGLGTSSILAAAIIVALWSATGKTFDNLATVHAVLCVEQMLTTGGGWQDQVGGIYGGIKAGSSADQLPLQVVVEPVESDTANMDFFDSRILLIFTGKPRLAKNLLQNVVRNWYAREKDVVTTCAHLIQNAKTCFEAFTKWNYSSICNCITTYYEQKQLMAPGTEPPSVRKIIDELRPYISSHTLAGAGGGGFLFCLLKNPTDRDLVKKIIQDMKGAEGAAIFSASLDQDGMKLSTSPVTP